jgi:hypothetical protein
MNQCTRLCGLQFAACDGLVEGGGVRRLCPAVCGRSLTHLRPLPRAQPPRWPALRR